jgi:hypothetical protein
MHTAHLFFLAMWGGLVLGEFVMELVCREGAMARAAAEIHYWLDLVLELPLLAAIVATGSVLLSRVWPPTPLHVVKIAAALVAIGCNLYCADVVRRRRARQDDPAALAHGRTRVFVSGIGVPFGLGALYIGLRFFLA